MEKRVEELERRLRELEQDRDILRDVVVLLWDAADRDTENFRTPRRSDLSPASRELFDRIMGG